jgi:hypothetical protein
VAAKNRSKATVAAKKTPVAWDVAIGVIQNQKETAR